MKINWVALSFNILIAFGLIVLIYSFLVIEQRKNKKIEESYKTIQQLSQAIIEYSKEPQTVTVLANEIMRYTDIEDVKKEENSFNVRR
jgi:uncharacterized membrane protein YecN with MAPEG domain